MAGPAPQQLEFSRPVTVDRLTDRPAVEEIEATAAERQALGRRFALLSLDRLAARLRLSRLQAGVVRIEGRFEAEVVQACVVSLEPVPVRLAEEFSVIYDASQGEERQVSIRLDAEEPPETLVGGVIDLGETVVQRFAMALDPYPRAPGAELAPAGQPTDDEPGEKGPFAALGNLARKG